MDLLVAQVIPLMALWIVHLTELRHKILVFHIRALEIHSLNDRWRGTESQRVVFINRVHPKRKN
jgi:hypothetical protein